MQQNGCSIKRAINHVAIISRRIYMYLQWQRVLLNWLHHWALYPRRPSMNTNCDALRASCHVTNTTIWGPLCWRVRWPMSKSRMRILRNFVKFLRILKLHNVFWYVCRALWCQTRLGIIANSLCSLSERYWPLLTRNSRVVLVLHADDYYTGDFLQRLFDACQRELCW